MTTRRLSTTRQHRTFGGDAENVENDMKSAAERGAIAPRLSMEIAL